MNRAIATVVCALGVVIGCGGSGGAKKNGVDSGAGSMSSGGVSSDASVSSGGTGGSVRTDAGTGGADSATTNGDACPAFTACGGDIVGKWRLNAICAWEQASGWCAEFVAEDRSGAQMEYTFASDGAFTVSYSGTIRETIRVPFKCMSSSDAGAAQVCAWVQESAQSVVRTDAGPEGYTVTAITCSADSMGCLCDEAFAVTASTKTGTYATRNGELVLSLATDAAAPYMGTSGPAEYCVSGNTLGIRSYDGNGKAGTNWFVK